MSTWSPITKSAEASRGFTLIELLGVVLVGTLLLGAFTSFYIAQQRATRRNEVEIETSQALRAVTEQISRDLRIVGRDLTRGMLNNSPQVHRFTTTATNDLDFYVDQYDCGVTSTCIDTTGATIASPQRRRYRYNNGTIERCTCNGYLCTPTCAVLADFAGTLSLQYAYADCGGTALTPSTVAVQDKVGRVDIRVNLFQGMVGGTNISRTETDSVTLRNLCN